MGTNSIVNTMNGPLLTHIFQHFKNRSSNHIWFCYIILWVFSTCTTSKENGGNLLEWLTNLVHAGNSINHFFESVHWHVAVFMAVLWCLVSFPSIRCALMTARLLITVNTTGISLIVKIKIDVGYKQKFEM